MTQTGPAHSPARLSLPFESVEGPTSTSQQATQNSFLSLNLSSTVYKIMLNSSVRKLSTPKQ